MAWIALRNPNSKRLLPFCRALMSPASSSSISEPIGRSRIVTTSDSPSSWLRSFATSTETKPPVNVGPSGAGHVKPRLPPATKKALAGLRRIDLEGLRWRVFDAKGQVLGRLASQISTVLQGKDKPTYTPNHDDGDMCIVLNAKDICVTGRKLTDKFYQWHTGYVGNLKERSLKDQMAKDPTEVIRKAVLRMLPRNKLRDDRDRKLRIFADDDHPFGDRPLEPYIMPPRKVREMRPRARRAMIRAQKRAEQQEAGASSRKNGKKEKEKVKVMA